MKLHEAIALAHLMKTASTFIDLTEAAWPSYDQRYQAREALITALRTLNEKATV